MNAFRGNLDFCSNFYPCRLVIQGIIYPTAEHAFVAAKTTDMNTRRLIARIPTAWQAKRYGRTLSLRADWDAVKIPAMLWIVRQKFLQNAELVERLRGTKGITLTEENEWGDRFWGAVGGVGRNELGKILMAVREEITRKEVSFKGENHPMA